MPANKKQSRVRKTFVRAPAWPAPTTLFLHLDFYFSTICKLTPSAFPTPAKRPHNSRMDTGKLQSSFDLHLPDWKIGVARMLSEVLENM